MPLTKRVIGLLIFLAVVVVFRHLALVGVTFVVLAHAFGFLGQRAGRLLHGNEKRGMALVLLLLGAITGLSIWLLIHFGGKHIHLFLTKHANQPFGTLFEQMHEDLLRRLPSWVPLEGLQKRVPEMVQPAVEYLRATGRTLLHLLIGLILAVIYVLDPRPVNELLHGLPQDSVFGAVRRYFGFLAEAILITISLQVLVALVNTGVTLPVLLALRLPHVVSFTLLIFVSSMVPVVGNLVSGAVLIVASYLYQGLWAVSFFVVTTFVLHKVEAYYLNPRLASRHVNLPALVLIISLILHEHIFGLVGLFLSFPVLYVGLNIVRDLRGAVAEDGKAAP
jgi:predicted PurR-regulated permease PerM